MSERAVQDVVGNGRLIVPPKPSAKIKFRWPPELVASVRAVALRSGRTEKEASEMLARWALSDEANIEIPVREDPIQLLYEWDAELVEKIRQIAESTDRSQSEVGELLMRKAVDRALAEFAELDGSSRPAAERRSKK